MAKQTQCIVDCGHANGWVVGASPIRPWLVLATVAVGISVGIPLPMVNSAAIASERTIYEASYQVEYNGIDIGTSRRTVSIIDGGFAVSQHTLTPHGLARLLGEVGYVDTTKIDLNTIPFRPIAFQRKDNGSEMSYDVTFQWADRVIEVSDGRVLTMPTSNVYDLESLIMLLMVFPERQTVGDTLAILESAERLRSYAIKDVTSSFLPFEDRQVSAIRYELQSVDDMTRGYSIWILSGHHNLLGKLIRRKQLDELALSMIEYQNFTSTTE